MANFSYNLRGRPDISDALIAMCPSAPFICNANPDTGEYDYDNIEWQTHPDWEIPTKEEVEEYLATLQNDWDTNVKYRQSRAVSYPSVEDQLDALWHAMDEGTMPKIEPMYSDIKATKDAFPKGDPTVELVLRNDVVQAKTEEAAAAFYTTPPVVRNYDPEGF